MADYDIDEDNLSEGKRVRSSIGPDFKQDHLKVASAHRQTEYRTKGPNSKIPSPGAPKFTVITPVSFDPEDENKLEIQAAGRTIDSLVGVDPERDPDFIRIELTSEQNYFFQYVYECD
jgi:hypothetical protein